MNKSGWAWRHDYLRKNSGSGSPPKIFLPTFFRHWNHQGAIPSIASCSQKPSCTPTPHRHICKDAFPLCLRHFPKTPHWLKYVPCFTALESTSNKGCDIQLNHHHLQNKIKLLAGYQQLSPWMSLSTHWRLSSRTTLDGDIHPSVIQSFIFSLVELLSPLSHVSDVDSELAIGILQPSMDVNSWAITNSITDMCFHLSSVFVPASHKYADKDLLGTSQ